MIKTVGDKTQVRFSRDEFGKIGVQTANNLLILKEIINQNLKIGEDVNKSDVKDIPTVVLDFNSIKSVDVMIKCLEQIKRNLSIDPMMYAYAC